MTDTYLDDSGIVAPKTKTMAKPPLAFPTSEREVSGLIKPAVGGLTKREYFAAMAMLGVESSNHPTEHASNVMMVEDVASRAVDLADALIRELERR